MEYLYRYLILINIICFIVFALDKKRSRRNQWRISEATLLLLSLIGGSLGGILSMRLFRHKTGKLKFRIAMPLLLIINILVVYYLGIL